jgi:hypothetical protein
MLLEDELPTIELQTGDITIVVGDDWASLKNDLHVVYIRPTQRVQPGRRGAMYYIGYKGDLPEAVTMIGKYVEESGWTFDTESEDNVAVMVVDDLLAAWEVSFS